LKLKIDFKFDALNPSITYHSKMVFTGSCFAQNIYSKLKDLKFDVHFLGNGIVFHPIPIATYLELCLDEKEFPEAYLFENKGIWHSWLHHGSVWALNKEELHSKINQQLKEDAEKIKQASVLVVTFGTSFGYEFLPDALHVANCHKVPANQFNKTISVYPLLLETWSKTLEHFRKINANAQLLFSVSPVKYLKDGIHQNNLSKANLLLLVDELCKSKQGYYFPAFEILQDELRDYRFYDEDFAHPNQQAIHYIFEQFKWSCLDESTQAIVKEIEQLNNLLNHRILHKGSPAHLQLEANKSQTEIALKLKYPYLKW
jgi:hypothetical protein